MIIIMCKILQTEFTVSLDNNQVPESIKMEAADAVFTGTSSICKTWNQWTCNIQNR